MVTEYEQGRLHVVIRRRRVNGTPQLPTAVESNEPVFSVLASCIDVAIGLLYHEHGRDALTKAVLEIDHTYFSHYPTARKWIDQEYLPSIMDQFPPVYIDEVLQSEGTLAQTIRQPFTDNYAKNCIIQFNARLIEKMMAYFHRGEMPAVTEWMFIFVNTLCHEIGHVLIGHMFEGRFRTPDRLPEEGGTARRYEGKSEGGRYFEEVLHGDGYTRVVPLNQQLAMASEGLVMRTYRKETENGIEREKHYVCKFGRPTIQATMERSKSWIIEHLMVMLHDKRADNRMDYSFPFKFEQPAEWPLTEVEDFNFCGNKEADRPETLESNPIIRIVDVGKNASIRKVHSDNSKRAKVLFEGRLSSGDVSSSSHQQPQQSIEGGHTTQSYRTASPRGRNGITDRRQLKSHSPSPSRGGNTSGGKSGKSSERSGR